MAEFTIYIGNKNYSSWSLRPWLALRHAGAAFEEVLIPLDQADSATNLRRHSPSGRVPVLQHGTLAIWETLASASTWPSSFRTRDCGRRIGTPAPTPAPSSNEMHAGFAALRDDLPWMSAGAGRWGTDWRRWDRTSNASPRSGANAASVSAAVAPNGAGDFLFGGFTIADAMFAPVVTRFVTYSVPLDPGLQRVRRRRAALACYAGLDRRRQGGALGDQRRCQYRRCLSILGPSRPARRRPCRSASRSGRSARRCWFPGSGPSRSGSPSP